MRKLYFSLLELLITIGIIAILAGMLLPVLNSVREKGMLVQCISHQIAGSVDSLKHDFIGEEMRKRHLRLQKRGADMLCAHAKNPLLKMFSQSAGGLQWPRQSSRDQCTQPPTRKADLLQDA